MIEFKTVKIQENIYSDCRRKQNNSHLFPAIRMNITLTVIKYQEIDQSHALGHMITIHGNYNLRPKPTRSTCTLQGGTLLYQGAYSEVSHLNTAPGNPFREG